MPCIGPDKTSWRERPSAGVATPRAVFFLETAFLEGLFCEALLFEVFLAGLPDALADAAFLLEFLLNAFLPNAFLPDAFLPDAFPAAALPVFFPVDGLRTADFFAPFLLPDFFAIFFLADLLAADLRRAAVFFFGAFLIEDFFLLLLTLLLLTLRLFPDAFLLTPGLRETARALLAAARFRFLLAAFLAGMIDSCRSEKNAELYIG